jgi:dynactin complex subunit
VDIKNILEYWKSIIGSLVVIIAGVYGAITWAEDVKVAAQQKALEEKAVIIATQQLIHNNMYQESRIDRKRDQIKEDNRELKNILEDVGNDVPTPRQARTIDELDDNIKTLKKDIEEIEVNLKTTDE